MSRKNGKGINNIHILILYVLFFCIAHWSILIGDNLMKWDIWDAQYPAGVLMTDALHSGTFPIWNPLMFFGTPYYSVVGMPIWYPSTILFALVGYGPVTVAIEYFIHVVIGAFGAFLFVGDYLTNDGGIDRTRAITISFFMGLVYGCSGIFLSNAQHIMIVISAAWIPYVIMGVRSYLRSNKVSTLLLTGMAAGLILLGGYPELFIDLFLILIPYMLYFNYKREKGIIKNIINSMGKLALLSICTVLASSIVLLPFILSMSNITRTAGMKPLGMNFISLLSTLIPGIGSFFSDLEVSMTNFYMGLVLVLFLPYILKKDIKHKAVYLILSGCCLLVTLGGDSFLHSLLYRLVPMYSTFRFPTVLRCFIVLFLLPVAAKGILLFVENSSEDEGGIIVWAKRLCVVTVAVGVVTGILPYIYTDMGNVGNLKLLSKGCLLSSALILVYIIIFTGIYKKKYSRTGALLGLGAMICIELLSFVFVETPITIASNKPTASIYDAAVQAGIKGEFARNANRNRNANFADSSRSTSGLDSSYIVNSKTFDEEGYLSYRLKDIETYKNSYNRSVIAQNPVMYLTNNIVNADTISYDTWINKPDVTPEQIYIEDGEVLEKTGEKIGTPEILEETEVASQQIDGRYVIQYQAEPISGTQNRKIKVYVEQQDSEVDAKLSFYCEEQGEPEEYEGKFQVYKDEKGSYIELFFPNTKSKYVKTDMEILNAKYMASYLIVENRILKANNVDIKVFGFNSITASVDAQTESYLTVLQANHHGWKAYVDGKQVDIKKVNNCFMALHMEKGTHEVVLKFRPTELFVGASISVMYILLVGIVLIIKYKREKYGKNTIAV